jgi:Recombination endonuclease VII
VVCMSAKRGPEPRIPDCHPDRKHKAKGFCASCYNATLQPRPGSGDGLVGVPKVARIPDCHPDRKHCAKGLCASCYQMSWMKAHPEADTGNVWLANRPEARKAHNRKGHLWHKHRTLVEQYTEAWHRQEGCCANPRCRAWFPLEMDDYRKGLHVYHDHKTGLFRGLLCPPCNVSLGIALENQERLLGLVEYLAGFTAA